MRKIGVLTSGGDSPGMNAAIRAIVHEAQTYEIDVYGFYKGYIGLINGNYKIIKDIDVQDIIRWGGSILDSSRCPEFLNKSGRDKAFNTCSSLNIDSLIIIGGNGSISGALELSRENDIKIIGLPGTIDNDIAGSEYSIGFDTAVNTATDAIDKIMDTATTMENLFFIEVMGRHCGAIALMSAVAGGADAVLIPEIPTDFNKLIKKLKNKIKKGKRGLIVIVAEGDDLGHATEIAKLTQKELDIIPKVTVLGHTQRGGSPSAKDRYLSTLLGSRAVECLTEGKGNIMLGIKYNKITEIPFERACKKESHVQKMFSQGIIDLLT